MALIKRGTAEKAEKAEEVKGAESWKRAKPLFYSAALSGLKVERGFSPLQVKGGREIDDFALTMTIR